MSEGANPWSPGILYSLWARLTWHIAWVKSSATAAIPHHGMLSVASIRWATGEVPPAALSARRLSALHTLRLQAKYSEPKREDDRKNEHEDRYRNEKRIGPNQNITWGGGRTRSHAGDQYNVYGRKTNPQTRTRTSKRVRAAWSCVCGSLVKCVAIQIKKTNKTSTER